MSITRKLFNFSVNLIPTHLSYKLIEAKYKHHACDKTFNWAWKEKNFNRIAIVNFLISKTHGWNSKYLEIGCETNSLFDSVAVKNKVGVDPATGGTHRMTSDDFFMQNSESFDVVFIDGLHEYQQVRRDAINALEALNKGGWIAFHDFSPSSWKEHHVPRLQNVWTGDCWKAAVELSKANGLEFKIIEIDHGVGLLRKTAEKYNIPDMSSELLDAEFDRFVKEVASLPIVSIEDAISIIEGVKL